MSKIAVPILVGTHHKTGTIWMQRTFTGIAAALDLEFRNLQREPGPTGDVYFAPHSEFPAAMLAGSFRGLHVIRDPRDVLISAMHYHQKSNENWLHRPRSKFGGSTYQQKLLSLADDDKLIFEAQNNGGTVIKQMLDWNYDNPQFFEAKYEDLITDTDLSRFGEILAFLGITGVGAARGLAIFGKNSLFSREAVPRHEPHVRSGRPRQWETGFRRRDGEWFLETLGDCLIRLGYEPDDEWVRRLAD